MAYSQSYVHETCHTALSYQIFPQTLFFQEDALKRTDAPLHPESVKGGMEGETTKCETEILNAVSLSYSISCARLHTAIECSTIISLHICIVGHFVNIDKPIERSTAHAEQSRSLRTIAPRGAQGVKNSVHVEFWRTSWF